MALAPEELSQILLKLVPSHPGIFYPDNFLSQAVQSGYPSHKWEEVEIALSEAWNWLLINNLIVPAPGINGRNGWMILSRRGAAMADE